jgi:hypothetical protein
MEREREREMIMMVTAAPTANADKKVGEQKMQQHANSLHYQKGKAKNLMARGTESHNGGRRE